MAQVYPSGEAVHADLLSLSGGGLTTISYRGDPQGAVISTYIDRKFFDGLILGESAVVNLQGYGRIRSDASSVPSDASFSVDLPLSNAPSSMPSPIPSMSTFKAPPSSSSSFEINACQCRQISGACAASTITQFRNELKL